MKIKALSPIIATVLLIVVAVVLVAILLSWGQNFIQKSTADADSAVDTSCKGASITITSCDYNSTGDTLQFVMINSGEIAFTSEDTFNLTLIDANNDLNSSNTDILDSNAFGLGESELITLTGYDAETPIKLDLRNSKCPGYFWSKTCS